MCASTNQQMSTGMYRPMHAGKAGFVQMPKEIADYQITLGFRDGRICFFLHSSKCFQVGSGTENFSFCFQHHRSHFSV